MYALLEFNSLQISKRTQFSKIKFSNQDTYNKLSEINDGAIIAFFKGNIKDELFYSNWEITKVVIPDNVVSIGKCAFLDCRSLKEVVIPFGVISIGEYAFGHCQSLKNIILPNSIEKIEKFAFSGCAQLETITWRGKTYYKYDEDNFFTLFNELKCLNIVPNDIGADRMFY